MRLPRRLLAAAVAVLVAATLLPAAHAAPPEQPECLPLAGGSTGLLYVGPHIPSTSSTGGFGPAAPPRVAATLPDRILFRTTRETFNDALAFALRGRTLYVRKARAGIGLPGTRWHRADVPACLDGTITAISADRRFVLALGPGRQLYSHDMPGNDFSPDRWTWRWGPYFWTGSGMTMFDDVTRWANSEFTSAETFTDPAGQQQHPIGVATVYLLRGDGRTITYLDPWLPADESREVCGPRGGTQALANLSASGSTVFAVGRDGSLWTRLYDFDTSGGNTVFGDYRWGGRTSADDVRWQLPNESWRRQPRPPGKVTDLIAISRSGEDASQRTLRVEGVYAGRRVVWQKQLTARTWSVVRRGGAVTGRRLPLAPLTSTATTRRFMGAAGGRPAEVTIANPACSPTNLSVRLSNGGLLPLRLHTTDGLRQETRERGLSDVPSEYNGAIEVPATVWRNPTAAQAAWIEANLRGRVTTAPVALTRTRLRFRDQCWELTLDGRPARPDQPRAGLPDGGIVVGRLLEMAKDGRSPSGCGVLR